MAYPGKTPAWGGDIPRFGDFSFQFGIEAIRIRQCDPDRGVDVTLKEELSQELEATRQDFHHLLDSVPEAFSFDPGTHSTLSFRRALRHCSG